MRVLLVSTYELGHQPLHLASPAARLLSEGHEVRCLDLSVEEWDPASFAWADKVAFSVPMHTAMRLALVALARIRETYPDLAVAFYGLYAAIGAAGERPAEVRIVGEYEDELVAWAKTPLEDDGPVRLDLGRKTFRVPARHLLPGLENYAKLEIAGDTRLVGYVEASHGCRHRCRHCPIPAIYDGRYRVTGLDTVLADVGQLVAAGAEHITFGDPDFLNAPRYARDVLAGVSASFPGLTYDLTVKVEHVLKYATIWDDLAGMGVVFVVSAFETTNDRILGLLDKGHTAADMARATETLAEAGIDVRPSWMPFTPWTESDDLPTILQFLGEHDLLDSTDPVQLTIRLLLPEGSLLLQLPEVPALLDGYDPALLSHRWRSPDPAIDHLQRRLADLAEEGGNDSWATLMRMWAVVLPTVRPPAAGTRLVPRLTEAWFCCAEPTSSQLTTVGCQPT